MFDKLIDFFIDIIDKVIPFYIIKQYQQGVLFRAGKYNKLSQPGIYCKIPFIDDVEIYPVVTTTLTLPVQSIVT